MPLTSRQKRHLRGLTHSLHPIVTVAEKGLSENVRDEIETALEHHELVKIKLRSDRKTRSEWISRIEQDFQAERVHVIGQVACFYRRNKDKPVIVLQD
jgi:RNA-binding protein